MNVGIDHDDLTSDRPGQLTKTQAAKVAEAVHALRPEWGRNSIMAALLNVTERASGCDVAIAAFTAAADPTARTPAVITSDASPHWPTWSPLVLETAAERSSRRTREIHDRRVLDELRQMHRQHDPEASRRGYAAAVAALESRQKVSG